MDTSVAVPTAWEVETDETVLDEKTNGTLWGVERDETTKKTNGTLGRLSTERLQSCLA